MALTRSWEARLQNALFEALNSGERVGCEASADIRVIFRTEAALHICRLAKAMGAEIDASVRDAAEVGA